MIRTTVTLICDRPDGPDSLCGTRVTVTGIEPWGRLAERVMQEAAAAGWRADSTGWVCPKPHESALTSVTP